MLRVTKTFSLFMFWIENIFLMLLFLIYEVCLVPFAYLKTLVSIMLHVEAGVLRKFGMILYWLMIGLVIDLTLIYQDFKSLMHVLCHRHGFSEGILH